MKESIVQSTAGLQAAPASVARRLQTIGEEIANSILHGLGVMLAVAGLVLLVLRGSGRLGGGGGAVAVTAYVIFTAAMICMFMASTLYHAIQHEGAKRIFRIFDHSAIYLFIAGTYTPFCLLALRGAWGWTIFGAEWGLAALGIVLYATNCKFLKKIELIVYLLMGWAIVASVVPLVKAISRPSLIFLAAGGFFYTMGTFFYRKHQLRGAHVTWHVFVLAGAICHYWSIWWI
jgi:hemolysin III